MSVAMLDIHICAAASCPFHIQCDQIGRNFAFWAIFSGFWRIFFSKNRPKMIFKGLDSDIFSSTLIFFRLRISLTQSYYILRRHFVRCLDHIGRNFGRIVRSHCSHPLIISGGKDVMTTCCLEKAAL
jgi:hypothetical protein